MSPSPVPDEAPAGHLGSGLGLVLMSPGPYPELPKVLVQEYTP